MLVAQSASQNLSEFSNDSESSSSIELNELNNNDTSRWNVANLNFFDFFYDDKSIDIDDVMKHINKNTYFRDVHLFIERARNVITIKNVDLIRENLWTCFRNTIFVWWIDEILIVKKCFIRHSVNDDQLKK